MPYGNGAVSAEQPASGAGISTTLVGAGNYIPNVPFAYDTITTWPHAAGIYALDPPPDPWPYSTFQHMGGGGPISTPYWMLRVP